MDLLTKLTEWASALTEEASRDAKANAAAASLDRVVNEMRAQRATARAQVSATPAGAARDQLERAIAMLDTKMEEVEAKRLELHQRLGRASRKRELLERATALVDEGRQLIAEGEALAGGEQSDERARQIRQRLSEIDAEVQKLKRQIR
jgi:hypothetical protein